MPAIPHGEDEAFKNKDYTGYGTLQGPKTTSTDTLSVNKEESTISTKSS